MKIAVIGATGFVGSQIVNELVNRNYDVVGISRTIHFETNRFKYLNIDIFNTQNLAETLVNFDVVISAYNPNWSNSIEMYNEYIMGYKAIQFAVKVAQVKRFIIIGGAGSLYNSEGVQLVDTENFPTEIKFGAKAARDYLNILKTETDLDWVFFSPAKEMHSGIKTGRTGKYRLGTDFLVVNEEGRNMLSVEDVAVVIADEIETPKHHQTRFTAAY